MTNKSNKNFSGIKSNSIYMGKKIGDIQNVFIFCFLKRIKLSPTRGEFNVITFLSNSFGFPNRIDNPEGKALIVVSLFPDYLSRTYDVTVISGTDSDVNNSNIKVISFIYFMALLSKHGTHGDLDPKEGMMFVFHGFSWSQILYMFNLYHMDLFGVNIPVRHTVNSLQIRLLKYLIPLFGSIEEVQKHLIEGTQFSTFWGSAKLDNPVYSDILENKKPFLSISMQFSGIVTAFLRVKKRFINYTSNANKLLAIESKIDSFSHEKKSLLLYNKKDLDKNSKLAQINSSSLETIIPSNTLISPFSLDKYGTPILLNTEEEEKKDIYTKKLEKNKEQFKQQTSNTSVCSSTSGAEGADTAPATRPKESESSNTDVKIQDLEAKIKRLTFEKENISSVLSELMFEHKKFSELYIVTLRNFYWSEILSELKEDLSDTFMEIEGDILEDQQKINIDEQKRKTEG
jgi:hypothetical protein